MILVSSIPSAAEAIKCKWLGVVNISMAGEPLKGMRFVEVKALKTKKD